MLVIDWMSSNPLTITPEEDVKSAHRLLRQHDFHQLPVMMNGKLVGMVTDRDLRDAPKRLKTVAEVMIYDPVSVSEDTTLEEAARIVCDRKINALPVTSGKNELVGIITVADILDGLLDLIGIYEEPIREKVEISKDVGIDEAFKEVFELFQITSERVVPFSPQMDDHHTFYFLLIACALEKLDKQAETD